MSTVSLTWIPVKKDAEGSAGAKSLAGLKDEILSTPGLEHSYTGKSADPNEPASVEIFDVWSGLDAIKAASSNPKAEQIKELFKSIADTTGEHQPYHNVVVFDNSFVPVAEAPVTHLTAIFVPTDVNKAEFEAAWQEGIKPWAGADGFVAGAAGWGQEEVDFPQIGKKLVFLAVAGWSSVDAAKALAEKAKDSFKGMEKYGNHTQTRFTTLTKNK